MKSSTLYPIKEACALVGCSERAAYDRARQGRPLVKATGDTPEVPILRICGTWKVPKHLLHAALRISSAIEVLDDSLPPQGRLPARLQSSAPHARPSVAGSQQQGVA